MDYDIYVLDESELTISGGEQLDGVNQGDGSHLTGLTITLNSNDWYAVSVSDNDADFDDNDGNQRLNGAQTIDGVTYADGTGVEAEYGLTLTDGVNTWTVVGFNVNNSSPAFGTVEGLAFIGGPGGFPPVGVPLTVVGSFEGPTFVSTEYATPICFVSGTMIETPKGSVLVEDLKLGDLVLTKSHGPQPIKWIDQRSFPAVGPMAPVRFAQRAIGNKEELWLSQQHRVLVENGMAELMFGDTAVLVPAVAFVNARNVEVVEGGTVTYHHFMFDQHQVVYANGVPAESFHPGEVGLSGLPNATQQELFAMFPDLSKGIERYGPSAYPSVRTKEAAALVLG